jgi:hypothetical protein
VCQQLIPQDWDSSSASPTQLDTAAVLSPAKPQLPQQGQATQAGRLPQPVWSSHMRQRATPSAGRCTRWCHQVTQAAAPRLQRINAGRSCRAAIRNSPAPGHMLQHTPHTRKVGRVHIQQGSDDVTGPQHRITCRLDLYRAPTWSCSGLGLTHNSWVLATGSQQRSHC